MRLKRINHPVFWPPFILLVVTAIVSITQPDYFLEVVVSANHWIIQNFQNWFSWSTFSFLLILIITYFSPLGNLQFGGSLAVPILSKWRLFSITLCSTIAIGILFWASAEPIYHFHDPGIRDILPSSPAAEHFAMSTLFMHWTFTPYAIYTLGALMFAYGFYNHNQSFSVGTYFFPLYGRTIPQKIRYPLDSICLYSLVAGISANLGVGILSISGGMQHVFMLESSQGLMILVVLIIVGSFVISSITGLHRGIQFLSSWNLRGFILLTGLILLFSPVAEILNLGWQGLQEYLITFADRSVNYSNALNDDWRQEWTTFYWANWLAWAPITCLFLGHLAKGYTVRTIIRFNLLYPALFSMLWMTVFGGLSLSMDRATEGYPMKHALDTGGPESVIYAIFGNLPFSSASIAFFLILAYLSFVTAADSATSAMSNISCKEMTANDQESPVLLKVIWGLLVGLLAITMVLLAGIDGIRMLSNLGGFPALFIFILIGIGMVRLIYLSFHSKERIIGGSPVHKN